MNVECLITVRSSFEHGETLARFEALEVSVLLDATTLLMFGNRARQALLVKALRLIALELPFKVLIWQDATGETWLSYTDFRWLAKQRGHRRAVADGVIARVSPLGGYRVHR